jgi:formylglycine-generating enzyme required for sulfatase activity
MHGNVWEWVEDCFPSPYYGAPTDGSATSSASCRDRRLRGGSWFNEPRFLRSANRGSYAPDFRNPCIGFRVARTLN